MPLPIQVTAYSGYKGDQRPCSFLISGNLYDIEDVLKRWYEPSCTCFKVVTRDSKLFVLRYEEIDDQWTVGDEYDGAALVRSRGIEIILVEMDEVRKAERLILSCEQCYPAGASIPFDWLLARVTGKSGLFHFLMAEVARCLICNQIEIIRPE
jgi:hypothetical protein